MEVGLGPDDTVLDGDAAEPAPSPKNGCTAQNFQPMSIVAKMPLGTEIGLGPGHIALDGDPLPPRKGLLCPFSWGSWVPI